MTEASPLVVDRLDTVEVVRLNRPEAANALTPDLLGRIGAAMAEAEDDPDIRAVVLTATGDRAFCAGLDLKTVADPDAMASAEHTDDFVRFVRGEVRLPVVGAANGAAAGGGFEMLLACDMAVAAAGARFGLPEVQRGLIAGGGGAIALGSRLPLAVAMELALTGELIDAERAYRLGLVNAVVAPERLQETALALAWRVAANGPLAVGATREMVRLAAQAPPDAWARLEALLPVVFASLDATEGARAFMEKRSPVFEGR